MKDILEESRILISKGAKEITYIGQTVNSWKYEKLKFYELLNHLQELEGLENKIYQHLSPGILHLR